MMADLEGDDPYRDHAKPELVEGILPAEETGVEVPDTWNHDPDECHGCEGPCHVAGIVDVDRSTWGGVVGVPGCRRGCEGGEDGGDGEESAYREDRRT